MGAVLIWYGENAKLLCNGTIYKKDGTPLSSGSDVTLQTPYGTYPVGSTFTLTSTDNSVIITGSAGADSVDYSSGVVNSGSYSSPNLIVGSITVPTSKESRFFLKANSGTVSNPTISSGSGIQRMHLFGVSDTATVTLTNSITNVLLSGTIVLKNGTQITLDWIAGLNKWVEAGRNDII